MSYVDKKTIKINRPLRVPRLAGDEFLSWLSCFDVVKRLKNQYKTDMVKKIIHSQKGIDVINVLLISLKNTFSDVTVGEKD